MQLDEALLSSTDSDVTTERNNDKKIPRPHQKEALCALLQAAHKQERYTCVMACGTGKTLLALWHAEQLQTRKILVLLPSLGLLNQTLHEWLANTRFASLKYLCVCSDQSVGNDDMLCYQPEELDFQVTTQNSEVTQFLSACASNDTIVIFSTYHSASVVGEALDQDGCFDLIIFDEAHKTAGEAGKAFSYALYDKHIKAKKRLFMTATPRILNSYQLKKQTIPSQIKSNYISMCDNTLYGDVVYSLNFKKAVELGIIVDYKIIISVVTSEMVNNILRSAKVKFKNRKVDALTVAHMLATQHAVREHGINKLISFHSRVDKAYDFQTMVGEHWFDLLNNFNAQHVSGVMSSSQRAQHITSFKNSNNGILTNARCLTEGIDVPVVDMVAFLCNKRSRIDIVQATGRVMRKAPGKQTGYILLPFYIKNDETHHIEETLKKLKHADYSDIWYVLKILADYDDSLKDIINISLSCQDELDDMSHSRLSKKIIITTPPDLPVETLKKTIQTLSIENVGDNWYQHYGALKKFKEENGNCHVPQNYTGSKTLWCWASRQRGLYRKGDLKLEYKQKLDLIGFIWEPNEARWEEMYAELVRFQKKHGHCNVSQRDPDNKRLGAWIVNQRTLVNCGKLSVERIRKLENLGLILENINEARWEEMYNKLVVFKQQHWHCNVPKYYVDDKVFGVWVSVQRRLANCGDLRSDRRNKLEALGFFWDVNEARWQEMYAKLVVFHQKYHHCSVSQKNHDDKKFLSWLSTQRKLNTKRTITAERKNKLDALGFVWDFLEVQWEENYTDLVKFQKKYGHCNVPRRYPANKTLSIWVSVQRRSANRGELNLDRKNKLEALGFAWDADEACWQEMYAKLVVFHQKHGHCNVPQKNPNDKNFGLWVSTQRSRNNRGTITTEQKNKLDALGFAWNAFDARWDKQYTKLVEFQKKYGHCHVPKSDVKLNAWVISQRALAIRGKLSVERRCKLEALGLVLKNTKEVHWREMYAELVKFQKKYGHCHVSTSSDYKNLGMWLAVQRTLYNQGKLIADRKHKLDILGVIWDIKGSGWETMYQQLILFKQQHGHCYVSASYLENLTLGVWASNQRALCNQGKLPEERKQKLDKINFIWDLFDARWSEQYAKLVEFQKKHGHCNVSEKNHDDRKFVRWLFTQRTRNTKGTITTEQKNKLDALGFSWISLDFFDAQWTKQYAKLVEFQKKYGHCNVPESAAKLSTWVINQRSLAIRGKLSTEHRCKLEALGLVLENLREARWQERYEQLKKYYKKHGNSSISSKDAQYAKLGSWLAIQRQHYRASKLSSERIQKLEALDMKWEPLELRWQEQYQRLKDYHQQYGHSNVSVRDAQYADLVNWLSVQRKHYRANKLPSDHIQKLQLIDVIWDPLEAHWQERYEQLKTHCQQHGYSNMSKRGVQWRSLSEWLSSQRKLYRQGKLSPDRIQKLKLLDEI